MHKLIGFLTVFLLLSSCNGNNFLGSSTPKHAGKRISILESEILQPSNKKIKIINSKATENKSWHLSNSFQRMEIPSNLTFSEKFEAVSQFSIPSFDEGIAGSSSSPVVSKDGKFFILNNNKVDCFDIANNQLIWSFKFDSGKERMGGGITLAKGIIYASNGSKTLAAIDIGTGKELWHFEAKNIITYPPINHNGILYAVTIDNAIYALDGKTGVMKWYESSHYQSTIAAASGVNIVAQKNIVIVSEAGGEIAIYNSEDGNKIFSITADITEEFLSTASVGIFQPPVISGSKMFFLNEKGVFSSLNLDTGLEELKIKTISGKYFWIDNNFVYILSDHNNIYCYQLTDGSLVWQQQDIKLEKSSFFLAPMLVNNKIYLFSKSGEVQVFDSKDGKFLSKNYLGSLSMSPVFYQNKLVTVSSNGVVKVWE
jgi:outer membrane protein assembly factor BamB